MPLSGPDKAKLHAQLKRMQHEVDAESMLKRMKAAAQLASVEDVPVAVRLALGDRNMSGWWRNRPITVEARAIVIRAQRVEVVPTRKAYGPMRVLETGRQAHGVGEGLLWYKMTKTKGLRTRHKVVGRKTGRGIGATAPKYTWTKATALMARSTPKRVYGPLRASYRKIWS